MHDRLVLVERTVLIGYASQILDQACPDQFFWSGKTYNVAIMGSNNLLALSFPASIESQMLVRPRVADEGYPYHLVSSYYKGTCSISIAIYTPKYFGHSRIL